MISLCKVNNHTKSRFPSRPRLLECLRQKKRKEDRLKDAVKKNMRFASSTLSWDCCERPLTVLPTWKPFGFSFWKMLCFIVSELCYATTPPSSSSPLKQHTRRSDSPPKSLAPNLAGFFHQGSQSSSHRENTKAVDRRKGNSGCQSQRGSNWGEHKFIEVSPYS